MSSTEIDTGSDELLASVSDGVGTIVLNRPERRNALTPAMTAALASALGIMEESDAVGALVITGAGPAFCAGGDVKAFNERGGEGGPSGTVDPQRVTAQQIRQRETVGRIYNFAKPVLAVLPGAAAGAGLGIALAADLRVGSERTIMATAFGAVGLSGDYGTAWLLQRLIGPARARELMFLGERVDAQRCLDLGLLNRVTSSDDLESCGNDIARSLANGPRQALRHMKSNLLEGLDSDLPSALDAEVPRHMECGVSADHRSAVRAFVEKRAPVFGGSS